jgi:hypothetical protein
MGLGYRNFCEMVVALIFFIVMAGGKYSHAAVTLSLEQIAKECATRVEFERPDATQEEKTFSINECVTFAMRGESGPNPAGTQPEATASSETEIQYRASAYTSKLNECNRTEKLAEKCCQNPELCITDASANSDKTDASTALKFLQFGTSLFVNLPRADIAQMCGSLESAAKMSAILNAALAQVCTSRVSDCKRACGDPVKELDNQLEQLELSPQSISQLSQVRLIENKKKDFESNNTSCMQYDNTSLRMQSQTIINVAMANMAKKCKEDTQAQNKQVVDPFAHPDCTTPQAVSSPLCQEQCSRPGASTDPNCMAYLNRTGQDKLTTTPNGNAAGGSKMINPFDKANLGGLGGEGPQDPLMPNVEAKNFGINGGAPGAGGGGGLGGGGDSGGSGNSAASSSGGGEGWNTDIAKGERAGGGYSSAGGLRTSPGGGFSGYGNAITTDKGKGFNLKDFLPGMNNKMGKPVAFRNPAQFTPGVSPAHVDIFQKITDRFYEVCLKDGLYDCASVIKMKKMKN